MNVYDEVPSFCNHIASNLGGLEDIENPNLSTFKLDVRDANDVQAFASSIEGSVDVLINNAGVADGRWQSISEIDMQHAMEVIEVNHQSHLYSLLRSLKAS